MLPDDLAMDETRCEIAVELFLFVSLRCAAASDAKRPTCASTSGAHSSQSLARKRKKREQQPARSAASEQQRREEGRTGLRDGGNGAGAADESAAIFAWLAARRHWCPCSMHVCPGRRWASWGI